MDYKYEKWRNLNDGVLNVKKGNVLVKSSYLTFQENI